MWLLSLEPEQEPIFGEPAIIRTERQDLSPDRDTSYVLQIAKYHPQRKLAERVVYRPDGTVSCRERYTYSSEAGSTVSTTTNENGTVVRTCKMETSGAGAQQTAVTLDPSGNELERVVSKFDDAGRLLESTSTSGGPGGTRTDLQVTYNAARQPLEATLVFSQPGGPPRAMRFHYEAGRLVRATVDSGDALTLPITTHRIDLRDDQGNWTQLTVLTTRPGEERPQPTAILRRGIQYYPPTPS